MTMDAANGEHQKEALEELAQALQLATFYSETLERELANTLWAHDAALLHAATARALTAIRQLRRAIQGTRPASPSFPTRRPDDL